MKKPLIHWLGLTGVAPREYFGIAERCGVFAAFGFNAVLGWHLFDGFIGTTKHESGQAA